MPTKRKDLILIGLSVVFLLSGCRKNAEIGLHITNVHRPDTSTYNSYYVGNRPPLQHLFFIKLPIGSIQPKGWLLESLKRAKNGLTGQLDKISAWLVKKNNAWLSPTGEGVHGWEEVPYWLRGFSNLAYVLGDSSMIAEAKVWINGVLSSQRDGGYFGPQQNRAGESLNLWPNMVMLWVLQSYYSFSHDQRVLSFMKDYFRWQLQVPDSLFLETYWGRTRAGDNLYSVFWLYNHTGEKWLLDLARKIHRNAANWQQPQTLPTWHGVNIAQGFREPAIYYLLSGDKSDLRATYRNFHLVRAMYGQVPGGMYGADENARAGYLGPRQATETCAIVEQMLSDEILLRITGDPFWADHLEEVAFNTYPATMMPHFRALRYFTAPNMITSDATDHHPAIQDKGPRFIMNPLSHRCCQHNHTMGWPYYAENLWMATPDNGLAALLYAASSVTAKVGDEGTKVRLEEQTHYPFSGKIKITVHTPEKVRFPLYLRIPGWCEKASVTVNGQKQETTFEPGSYARIENTWQNGDQITLNLPREVTITRWARNKRWPRNKNSVSVNYGPLTFSLKIKQKFVEKDPTKTAIKSAKWQSDVNIEKWPAIAIYPESPWNYGLVLNNKNPAEGFKIVHKPWPENNYPFTPETVPIKLITTGKRIPSWTKGPHGLVGELPKSPVEVDTPAKQITLIPMGATRLRISVFPLVK